MNGGVLIDVQLLLNNRPVNTFEHMIGNQDKNINGTKFEGFYGNSKLNNSS